MRENHAILFLPCVVSHTPPSIGLGCDMAGRTVLAKKAIAGISACRRTAADRSMENLEEVLCRVSCLSRDGPNTTIGEAVSQGLAGFASELSMRKAYSVGKLDGVQA